VEGSNNNVDVFKQSPSFTNVFRGDAQNANFTVNGHEYNQGYCGGQISPGSTGRIKDLTKGPRAQ
jgi:hypothetical protein